MFVRVPSFPRLLSGVFLLSTTLSSSAMAANLGFQPGPAGWDYYSYQNILTGATLPLQQSANYGQGVTVATIDTGVESSWVGFGGLTIKTASCLNQACASTVANSDDNGHGTFVASEIVGGVEFTSGTGAIQGMIGVAPFANLDSVKVLNAQGSGNSTDVANGIMYAVNQGAKVINLSLGPTGTAADQMAFYRSLAPAINYAASQNAVIVFAGGNSSAIFMGGGTMGSSNLKTASGNAFTDAALQRMIFVGATDAQKQWAVYSNIPATAGIYSTTGKFYSYQSMWLVADGGGVTGNGTACVTCIVGAPNVPTATYLALDAGTSMAAPQVTGGAALLAARWPQLITQGTIAKILEMSATSLGNSYMYGDGFLNLTQAFQPIGGLSVINSGGNFVSVGSGSGSVLSSGALGSMSKLSAALSNFTAYDSFQRNFTMNLSGLVTTRGSSSPAGQSVAAPAVSASTTHFADGSSLAFGNMVDDNMVIDHPSDNSASKGWFMSLTDASGSVMAAGSGFPASASFADAMWGTDSRASSGMVGLGVSNSLMNLAEGGTFVSFGSQLSGSTRVAFAWSESPTNDTATSDWTKPNASSFGTGINTSITDYWKGGITLGLLNEQSGVLGTTYATNGPLGLGGTHSSMSMGVSSAFDLGDKRSFLIDAAITHTDGAEGNGLISSITPLYARTFGAALVQNDTLANGDNLSLSVRSPLKVFSGSASLVTSSVDNNGNPVSGSQRVGLTPNGSEVDFAVGYSAPVSQTVSWNATVDERRNVDNVQGANDTDFLIGTKITF